MELRTPTKKELFQAFTIPDPSPPAAMCYRPLNVPWTALTRCSNTTMCNFTTSQGKCRATSVLPHDWDRGHWHGIGMLSNFHDRVGVDYINWTSPPDTARLGCLDILCTTLSEFRHYLVYINEKNPTTSPLKTKDAVGKVKTEVVS